LPLNVLLSLAAKFFYKEGNYVVKWNNAYLHADAQFTFDSDGKAITLK
jgi:hypothetical protein